MDFILSPLTWIVVLMILGFCMKNGSRKRILFVASFTLLLFFTNPFVAHKVVDIWELQPYNSNAIEQPYDVGILLGGSLKYYDSLIGRPVYSQSVDRLLQTIALYKERKIKKILLSGGSGVLLEPENKESVLVLRVLLQSGVLLSDVMIENESRNTYENALFSTKIINGKCKGCRVLLITSAFHMRRSIACFKKAGLNVTPFPVDKKSRKPQWTPDRTLLPDIESLGFWDMLSHEWVGMISYKMAGYI
ncbi:MAG: YdcF family protein [Bacteroidetes bacterium]|nr:YdcF family protein [Bacteroidota bacterium]